MTVTVVRGDARDLPLPDGSVDLIITSPPYFGLRSYTDAGEHYDGQIGSEATPAEWLAAARNVAAGVAAPGYPRGRWGAGCGCCDHRGWTPGRRWHRDSRDPAWFDDWRGGRVLRRVGSWFQQRLRRRRES